MSVVSTLNENMVFILEKQNQILEASKEMTSEGKEYILKGIAAQFGKENNNNRSLTFYLFSTSHAYTTRIK